MTYRFPLYFAIFIILLTIVSLEAIGLEEKGIASWYGGIFQGRLTANGEVYDTYGFTCAHKTLPFGTILKVKNLKNQKVVQVRVNDRGPFVDNRIIDLTYAAAKELDMIRDGTAEVLIRAIHGGIPAMEFNIRIGSWSDLDNVKRHKNILEKAKLYPKASMDTRGITRLELNNVLEAEVIDLVSKLTNLGYTGLMITQVTR